MDTSNVILMLFYVESLGGPCTAAQSLDDVCVDGVSLTHGAEGSRQHIWTFASAVSESVQYVNSICACSNTQDSYMQPVPPFIGNNYFCDSGNSAAVGTHDIVYADDPLWDGEGCGPDTTCCEFNNPPWFCITLPQPTTEDIEMRICCSEGVDNEDIIISLIEINIM